MRIRDAASADAEGVATVARASWHAAYDDVLGADTVDSTVDEWYDPDSLAAQFQELEGRDAVFLVAEADDLVGFTNAGPARDGESDPEEPDAFLSRLYVHPECWGEGIGTALAGRVARWLQDAGYERVWLEVFEANERAREFYGALGFERVGAVNETFDGTDVTTVHLAADVGGLVATAPSQD